MSKDQQRHLENLRQILKRRLYALKEKEAALGYNTPAEIITEIEDIQAKLDKLNSRSGSNISLPEIEDIQAELDKINSRPDPNISLPRFSWLWIITGGIVVVLLALGVWWGNRSASPMANEPQVISNTMPPTRITTVLQTSSTPEIGSSTPTSIPNEATIMPSTVPSSCPPQSVNPNNDAAYYYQRGRDYYQKGVNYQNDIENAKPAFRCAIGYFTYAIALKDKYIEAYGDRALTYYAMGDNDSAIQDYTQAINLARNDKEMAVYHYHRGLNYYLKGHDLCKGNSECTLRAFMAAIEDYTATIHAIPNCADAYTQRASVYRQRNKEDDIDRAIADDEQASKLKEVSVPCSS